MTIMINQTPVTLESFEAFINRPENADRHFELINGEIVEKMSPSRQRHTVIGSRFCIHIGMHLEVNDLPGFVTGETGGYEIEGERIIPDCAYVSDDVEPSSEVYSKTLTVLVIEVISDEQNSLELERLRQHRQIWLRHGVTVWEAHQFDKSVDVYTPDGRYEVVTDTLTFLGLPGLKIPLERIFR
jgi:Uma2 family endonuclease